MMTPGIRNVNPQPFSVACSGHSSAATAASDDDGVERVPAPDRGEADVAATARRSRGRLGRDRRADPAANPLTERRLIDLWVHDVEPEGRIHVDDDAAAALLQVLSRPSCHTNLVARGILVDLISEWDLAHRARCLREQGRHRVGRAGDAQHVRRGIAGGGGWPVAQAVCKSFQRVTDDSDVHCARLPDGIPRMGAFLFVET